MRLTEKPQFQEFHIDGVKHISPTDAYENLKSGNAILIDVREENEVMADYVPLDYVLNHPMSVIVDRLPFISKEQNIILACPGGVRSSKVANLLNVQGYTHVANLDGGLTKWKEDGLPYYMNNKASSNNCCCPGSNLSGSGDGSSCC